MILIWLKIHIFYNYRYWRDNCFVPTRIGKYIHGKLVTHKLKWSEFDDIPSQECTVRRLFSACVLHAAVPNNARGVILSAFESFILSRVHRAVPKQWPTTIKMKHSIHKDLPEFIIRNLELNARRALELKMGKSIKWLKIMFALIKVIKRLAIIKSHNLVETKHSCTFYRRVGFECVAPLQFLHFRLRN